MSYRNAPMIHYFEHRHACFAFVGYFGVIRAQSVALIQVAR